MAMTQDEHWMDAQRKRIKEAFALFDKDKKGEKLPRQLVVQEEVSTIMRYLGAYPSEKAMAQEILPDMQGDDVMAAVTYSSFETKMLEILASRAWDPDPPEVLLRAFRAIDEKGCGYIETAKMNELLVSKGTPFRAKEIEAFLSVAKDTETGHIYFEDYVASLTTDG
ncbi:unnamed protein product [Ectocarpus sp. 12 AP-2014]